MLIQRERYLEHQPPTSSCSVRKPVRLEWPQQTKQGPLRIQHQARQEKIQYQEQLLDQLQTSSETHARQWV